MDDQLVATFYYDGDIPEVNIFGVPNDIPTESDPFNFYDAYDSANGECLNEGSPFYEFPTWLEVKGLLPDAEEN